MLRICLHVEYIWHLLYVCVSLLVSFPTGNWRWWTKDFSELLLECLQFVPTVQGSPDFMYCKRAMGEDTPPAYLCPNQTLCKHVHVRNSGSWFCRSTSQIRAFWGGIPFLNHPKPPFGVRSCDVLSYHLHLLFCRCCGNHTTRSPTTAVAADLDCIHHDFHYR